MEEPAAAPLEDAGASSFKKPPAVVAWGIMGPNWVGLNEANDQEPTRRAKKVSGRSLLGWRLKTLQALSICNKSLPTDRPISCYLWKRNIYSEAVRSEIPASPCETRRDGRGGEGLHAGDTQKSVVLEGGQRSGSTYCYVHPGCRHRLMLTRNLIPVSSIVQWEWVSWE